MTWRLFHKLTLDVKLGSIDTHGYALLHHCQLQGRLCNYCDVVSDMSLPLVDPPDSGTHLADPAGAPPLRIELLGQFRVTVGDQAIPARRWRQRKAGQLLKLLALAPNNALHWDQVLDALWPDLDPSAANRNLRYALHVARHTLETSFPGLPRALHLASGRLSLHPHGPLWIDSVAFEDAASTALHGAEPSAYERALSLYHGDLLPDERYEDWPVARREALRETFLLLLTNLATLYEARDRSADAITLLERSIAQEPSDEEAHFRLIRLLASTNQRSRALRQYVRLRDTLRRDLDSEPSVHSQQLYAAILTRRFPDPVATASPKGNVSGAPKHNLPAPLTSFIGRNRELGALGEAVERARLITLLGAGGCGKTRLAIEVASAASAAATFTDGRWWVDLATVTDPALVPYAVLQVLGVRAEPPDTALDTLIGLLGTGTSLLVLDNCEHLIEPCAALIQVLLAACAELHLLATSRERLHLLGELVWRVPPFELPAREHAATLEELIQHDAIRLFCERARLVRPDFRLTSANASSCIEICRHLAGLPLALELAAARLAHLTSAQIAGRLDDALGLLTVGDHASGARQHTLRSTLDWSYALLSPDEQALFRRMAVFAGSWTLAAAEVVGVGTGVASDAILELLAALVDKSLVVAEYARDEAAYRFLEPIRQYATEHLRVSGEADASAERHARYFVEFAEAITSHLLGQDQAAWFMRLERERDNLRVALRWAGREQPTLALRLVGALWWFWYSRGEYHEGRDAILGVLRLGEADGEAEAPTSRALSATRARVFLGACALLWRSGEYLSARAYGEEGLALYRALEDPRGTAWMLIFLSHVCGPLRDFVAGPAYIAEALRLFRQIDDPVGLARTLNALGETARQEGDYTGAAALFDECLTLDRLTGNLAGLALRLMNMGFVLLRQEDAAHAAMLLRESLELSQRLENMILVANCLDGLAASALLSGRPLVAARLFGSADAVYDAIRTARDADPPQQIDYQYYLARTHAVLDAEAFAAAWSAGRTLDREVAIAEALAPVTDLAQVLSTREREVAALIAQGATNAQIAAALGLSRRTADTHVGHILRKLGLTSRAQVAALLVLSPPAG
jgi:predicted ATPase/DNA-binding SARP family transcriptional activator/DNA-binding CsgD family transcriptional regulator